MLTDFLLRLSSKSRLALGLFFALFVALGLRCYLFVDHYAVNVMYWDQWDFFSPVFRNEGPWAVFNFQHGPHRQGIGMLITWALSQLSGFDSRWDCFAVVHLLGIGTLVTGFLVWKTLKNIWVLALLPAVFFNVRQFEEFVAAANISHGAMPVLLLVLLCYAWFIKTPQVRYATLAVLTVLATFTGFGIFAGCVMPCLLAVELVHKLRQGQKKEAAWIGGALAFTIAGWLLFMHHYRFDPAVGGYHFPIEKPVRYLYFIAGMMNNYFGLDTRPFELTWLGLGMFAVMLGLMVYHGLVLVLKGVESNPLGRLVFLCSSFTILYCANTAVGRAFLGWHEASAASRYVTLMVPFGLALVVQASALSSRVLKVGALCLLTGLLVNSLFLRPNDQAVINWYSNGRRDWKEAYLKYHDEAKANEVANFKVHPLPQPEKLRFFEENGYNLFKERKEGK